MYSLHLIFILHVDVRNKESVFPQQHFTLNSRSKIRISTSNPIAYSFFVSAQIIKGCAKDSSSIQSFRSSSSESHLIFTICLVVRVPVRYMI